GGYFELEEAFGSVDRDPVSLQDERDGPADRRLRRHVPHNQTVGAAGESAVGDETDAVAETGTDDRRRWGEHLPHPRAADGPLVPNHDHITRPDEAREDRVEAGLFGIEDASRPVDPRLLHSRDLGDAALLGQVAPENRQVALRIERVRPGTD